jgi:hypothetical protein
MDRYVGFCFQNYEEGGGWNDVLTDEEGGTLSFTNKEEAVSQVIKKAVRDKMENGQIVDLHTGEMISIYFHWRTPYGQDCMWVKDPFVMLHIEEGGVEYTLTFDKRNKMFLDEEGNTVRNEHFLAVEKPV